MQNTTMPRSTLAVIIIALVATAAGVPLIFAKSQEYATYDSGITFIRDEAFVIPGSSQVNRSQVVPAWGEGIDFHIQFYIYHPTASNYVGSYRLQMYTLSGVKILDEAAPFATTESGWQYQGQAVFSAEILHKYPGTAGNEEEAIFNLTLTNDNHTACYAFVQDVKIFPEASRNSYAVLPSLVVLATILVIGAIAAILIALPTLTKRSPRQDDSEAVPAAPLPNS